MIGRGVTNRGIWVVVAAAALVLCATPLAHAEVFPAGGISYVVEQHTASPGAPTGGGANTLCPDGTRPLSGGLSNNAGFEDLWLNSAHPAQSSGSSGYTGWGTQWQEFSIASDVAIKTYTICDETKPRYVQKEFEVDPNSLTPGKAKCPGDRHVYGGGGEVENGNGDMLSSHPYDGPDAGGAPDDGWRVQAQNLNGISWGGTVWAVCGKVNPRYVSDSDQVPVGQQGYAQATCPTTGKRFLIGGGHQTSAGEGQVLINASNPFIHNVGSAPSRQWISYVDNRFGEEQTHTAFAICSKALN